MDSPVVLLALTLCLAPAPDLLMPGERSVRHELVIESSSHFRQHRFVAGPIRGFHGVAVVEPGLPFRFSSKYGTRVYALPLDVPVPEDAPGLGREPEGWPESARSGKIPVWEVRGVPISSPVHRILTTLRVEEVTAEAVRLAVVSEARWDRHGRPVSRLLLPLLLAISALGVIGILWLRRRPRVSAAT